VKARELDAPSKDFFSAELRTMRLARCAPQRTVSRHPSNKAVKELAHLSSDFGANHVPRFATSQGRYA